jgi:cysteinyl-tRNA synthetase
MPQAALTLYNSLSRSAEPFRPLDPADVRVYSCGPTVYNYAHLGNLRAYVFTDTLARTLRWKGYPLTHVMNITDVGHLQSDADEGTDKMEARARETGKDIWAIARHYTEAFKRNLQDLNVQEVNRMPLATDHVDEMIAFAAAIADRHCYLLDGGLYFDTATVPDYGRLAGRAEDEREGRIDPVEGKRHPEDFAIWRRSAPGENRQMEWDSPWGRGAPGWHLECSVMSRLYLGERFDIHTGGIDHREIHHPNEIAQNQAHRGCGDEPGFTGATVWMHNNFLVERAGKMSKSSGEFLTLQTALDRGFHPLAYRLMCLQAHYRSEMEFSWEGLAAAAIRLKRLVQTVATLRHLAGPSRGGDFPSPAISDQLDEFDRAISDDLATPRALVALDRLLSLKKQSPASMLGAIARMDEVLGLSLLSLDRADLRVRPADATIDERAVAARLGDRVQARAARDFARSDAIRAELAASGVDVMDGDALGWDWRPKG